MSNENQPEQSEVINLKQIVSLDSRSSKSEMSDEDEEDDAC